MPSPGPLEYLIILAMVVVLMLLIYVVVVAVARGLHRVMPATTLPRDPALDALRVRLANGEIDEGEFQRVRSVLQGR